MPLAAALHSQDSTQRLPVHGDGDEIISRRDGRCATEATEPAPPAATADRCATKGDPAFPPPPPPPPPGPNPKRCARPCTSPASSAFLIGSSCCALPPAFVNESNTTLIRETSHAESRFCDGDSATGGGFLPWKFLTPRCRPAPAVPPIAPTSFHRRL